MPVHLADGNLGRCGNREEAGRERVGEQPDRTRLAVDQPS
jgi:hypothetical protein